MRRLVAGVVLGLILGTAGQAWAMYLTDGRVWYGLDRQAQHATQRVNLVVAAKSPIRRIREHARARGWTGLRLVSTAGTTYNRDYHGETEEGAQIPALNVFVRSGERIHHFYNAELLYAPHPEGQDPRHVDLIWPLWNLFDLTPEGRGTDWYPRLAY